jgi:hypothetical protein
MIHHLPFQVILPGYHSFSDDGDFQDWTDNTVSSHDILKEEVQAFICYSLPITLSCIIPTLTSLVPGTTFAMLLQILMKQVCKLTNSNFHSNPLYCSTTTCT